jgi:hypothetical protein
LGAGEELDFCDEGKLASCFGIAPRIRTSNQTERCGRITKQGGELRAKR